MPKIVKRFDVTSLGSFYFDAHARKQLRDRSILKQWATIVVAYGELTPRRYRSELTGNEDIFRVSDPIQAIKADLGIEIASNELECLQDIVVVVTADGKRIETAWRKNKHRSR
jgi:hypothetical protein